MKADLDLADMTDTPLATAEQLSVCERFGSEVVVATSDTKVGIALSTLDQLPLNAIRHKPSNGTCGWYIWGGEYSPDPDFFQALHLAHLSKYCQTIIPYLALAPGWGVILAPDYEDVWFDERRLVE
ncbi:MAG: hypothetical protein FD131_4736 [Rhodocyclaceae bacterium]|nr:MAG: hypothetical protein FD131_4736 [Rhodocyclaceae bacterium]